MELGSSSSLSLREQEWENARGGRQRMSECCSRFVVPAGTSHTKATAAAAVQWRQQRWQRHLLPTNTDNDYYNNQRHQRVTLVITMMRRRLTPQEQLDAVRDVKLGMKRSEVMKKYQINYHSTLSQILERRGHQVKLVKSGLSHQSSAAAAALHRARNGKQSRPTIRCVIRNPQLSLPRVSQISHIDPRTSATMDPVTANQPLAGTSIRNSSDLMQQQPQSSSSLSSPQNLPEHRRLLTIQFSPRGGQRKRMSAPMPLEEKIDLALSRISKLNQKLMVRRGQTVFCTCCNRDINFRYNTVIARVSEHSLTNSHNKNIQLTREQRHQIAAFVADENGNDEVPVNGGGGEAHTSRGSKSASPSRGMRYDAPRVRGRFARKDGSMQQASSASSARVPDPAEERAKRQPEFERDLVQAFLETGVPIHKLNMYPMRNFLKKWAQMRVPRYEEEGHEYGF